MIIKNINYFDGLTSKSILVEIQSLDTSIQISLEEETLHWDYNELMMEQLTESELKVYKTQSSLEHFVITDQDEILAFKTKIKKSVKTGFFQYLLDLRLSTLVVSAILGFLLLLLIYLFAIPFLAEKIAVFIPTSYANTLGDAVYKSIVAEHEIDHKKSAALKEFAYKLDFDGKEKLRLSVLEGDVYNAFSLPNGDLIFYTALLDSIQTPEALTALIGHEAAHYNNADFMKQVSKDYSNRIVIAIIFGNLDGAMGFVTNNIQQIQSLSYSRNHEEDADKAGVDILVNNNLDSKGIIDLLDLLKDKSTTEHDDFLEFFSTHPNTQKRIDKVSSKIKKNQKYPLDQKLKAELNQIFKNIK